MRMLINSHTEYSVFTMMTDMQKPLNFYPIQLKDQQRAESIRKQYGNTLYLYTFASLFVWQKDEQYAICFGNDAFLIKNGAEGEHAYLFPCGSDAGKKALIDALLQQETPVFYSVTDEDKAFLESAYPDRFEFVERRNDFIYLFDKDAQIELKGKEYKKQRHQIHIGESSAENWTTEPLTASNIDRAMVINHKWAETKGAYTLADLDAAECALRHFDELSLQGLLFQADGEDTAYVISSYITPHIIDLSFCKGLGERRDFFVRWKYFSSLPQEVKTIDSEEDMGNEGLRINKLARHPSQLIRIWKGSLKR